MNKKKLYVIIIIILHIGLLNLFFWITYLLLVIRIPLKKLKVDAPELNNYSRYEMYLIFFFMFICDELKNTIL